MNVRELIRPLLDLPGVEDAVAAARDAIDKVHQHPANRRGWSVTAAEASVRAARASAAVEGADTDIPEGGQVADPVLKGALRVAEALGGLLPTWQRAPLQAVARLHVLAAADLADEDALGRPRASDAVSARLDLLAKLVVDSSAEGMPGAVVSAIVHGELLALAPFGTADGVVARAAARLSVIGSGLDPKGLVVPEVGYFRRSQEYAAAAQGFAAGDGVGEWVVYCCRALEAGAREAKSIADAVGA